jgi:putative flippase GtrA
MTHYRQFIKFALVGVIGFVVDAATLYLMLQIGIGYFKGRAISFISAVFTTWLVNRQFTFVNRPDISPVAEITRYFIAMSLGGAVNYSVYSIVIIECRNMAFLPLIAVATGSIAGLFFNFLSAKMWVFKI